MIDVTAEGLKVIEKVDGPSFAELQAMTGATLVDATQGIILIPPIPPFKKGREFPSLSKGGLRGDSREMKYEKRLHY